MPPYWVLLSLESLLCAALWIPNSAVEQFQQTPPGRTLHRAWTVVRWPSTWRRG